MNFYLCNLYIHTHTDLKNVLDIYNVVLKGSWPNSLPRFWPKIQTGFLRLFFVFILAERFSAPSHMKGHSATFAFSFIFICKSFREFEQHHLWELDVIYNIPYYFYLGKTTFSFFTFSFSFECNTFGWLVNLRMQGNCPGTVLHISWYL